MQLTRHDGPTKLYRLFLFNLELTSNKQRREKKQLLVLQTIDRKLADLKAYRRARGLCDHCGEKWSRDHKCAQQVGLHVLDELYALFADEDAADGPTTYDEPEDLCLCLFGDSANSITTQKHCSFRVTYNRHQL